MNDIRQGDCLELMKLIADESVDMILCDLPYGVLNKSNSKAKWDSVVDIELLWKQYTRIIKDRGAIILTAQDKFSAKLMLSNEKMHRYNLIWKKKERVTGFLNSNRMPLRNHEDILVFYKKLPTYNPQMTQGEKSHSRGHGINLKNSCYGNHKFVKGTEYTTEKFPISILNFDKEHSKFLHPTQKPVTLFEYLIKTYTNEGDLVLDNCVGSGTTNIACLNTNRQCIGMEKDEKYFKIAKKRLEKAKANLGDTKDEKKKHSRYDDEIPCDLCYEVEE